MTLIASHRHTADDIRQWMTWEKLDAAMGPMEKLAAAAIGEITRFFEAGPGYVGTSWGKDSTTVAHLSRLVSSSIPLVWVRVGERENPDCVAVRDAFLAAWPGEYLEVAIDAPDAGTGSLARGAAVAAERFGDRYVSGVRAEESATRRMRVAVHGLTTIRTCAPIGRWTGMQVFAYLHRHGLPVHPAYACTWGGALDRVRVRVAPLGGEPGRGHGRAEWERAYYPELRRFVSV